MVSRNSGVPPPPGRVKIGKIVLPCLPLSANFFFDITLELYSKVNHLLYLGVRVSDSLSPHANDCVS